MIKMLIVDDEPKIRKGLRGIVQDSVRSIEVIEDAQNGYEAIEKCSEFKPDICIVDIFMPGINGLELIDRLKCICPKSIMIVISGYDEFKYAQQSIKLNVYRYILKPVDDQELISTLEEAARMIMVNREQEKRRNITLKQLNENYLALRGSFLRKWVNNELEADNASELLSYYNISFESRIGVALLQLQDDFKNMTGKIYDPQIDFDPILKCRALLFLENETRIGVIYDYDEACGNDLAGILREFFRADVFSSSWIEDLDKVPCSYANLIKTINAEKCFSLIIRKAVEYIEKHFTRVDLDLNHVCEYVGLSPNYFSKLFKQEVGSSFSEYLTECRIRKAIELMQDPKEKIYEIASRIGYESQHYFCYVFKKVKGISPSEYRKKIL